MGVEKLFLTLAIKTYTILYTMKSKGKHNGLQKKEEIMDEEKLISMAKVLAKPYFIVCIILSILLAVSVVGNIYQATQKLEVSIEQDYDSSDFNVNKVK